MGDRPEAFSEVVDIALASVVQNIVADIPGSQVSEDSLVQIALNGETTDVQAQISIGGAQVFPQGNVTVQATAGVLPITPDDIVVTTLAKANEQITIKGTNLDAVAARELRTKVQIFGVKDITILSQALRGVGIPVAA